VDERAWSYLRTLVFAALLGIPVAFAAVLFQSALHHATELVWEEIPDALDWTEPTWWYVVLVTGLAGVLVAAALRLPGHGGHSPLEGLGLGATPLIELPSILLAASATLALGLVLGPEAPLIALGLGLGSVAVRLVRVEGTEAELLVLAGAFAAIAALFGGPLVAAFLILELAVASGAIPARAMGRALLPGFVAAGTGALVFTGIGDWRGLEPFALAVPGLPAYDTVRIADLGWCLLVAATVAAVIVALRHVAHEIAERARGRVAATLVAAGLLVGVLAVLFRAIADRPVDLVLFSGQEAMPAVIAEASAGVLLLLVAAKGLAYALSLGGGFRGGPVFPALLLGAAIGTVAADALPGLVVTPAVAAGIAAATAAVLRVPFTAALLATLLVGSSAEDVAPIAVLAAAVGWLVTVALPNPEDRTETGAESDAPDLGLVDDDGSREEVREPAPALAEQHWNEAGEQRHDREQQPDQPHD
jgi:H+/Cl- antiporter ClcA